ncbi:hypothetical protein CKF54_00465 [Psittacicella hinzii]|uniref:Uncharacterized protein n=1 Tax=Psittacicella hinzii TaxID=2028575 RepID=A0A3A1Y875_9GAMM|nr:hypothetical protein [Psittacicella hinzii]RIY34503.1 hypothetical protein CKF54_00465 [Psittacicella hinzii]
MIIFHFAKCSISEILQQYAEKYKVNVTADNSRKEPVNNLPVTLCYGFEEIQPIFSVGDNIVNRVEFTVNFRLIKAINTAKPVSLAMYSEGLLRVLSSWHEVDPDDYQPEGLGDFADLEGIVKEYKKTNYMLTPKELGAMLDDDPRVETMLFACTFTMYPIHK